jgi:hypothetical protein
MSGSKMKECLSRGALLRAGLAGGDSIRQQARRSGRAFLQRRGATVGIRGGAKFKNGKGYFRRCAVRVVLSAQSSAPV